MEALKRTNGSIKWTEELKHKGSVKRKGRSNEPGIRVSTMLDATHWYALRPSAFFKLTMRFISFDVIPHQLVLSLPTWFLLRSKIYPSFKYSTIIDATLQDLRIILPRFYHHWCYAQSFSLQSPNLIDATDLYWSSIFWKPLMLRSKIFSSSFQNQRFYAQRSSPHFSNTMLRFQIFSSLFRHHRCCNLRSSPDCSQLLPALMLCLSLRFFQLYHHWCYARRSSPQFSSIFDVTL